MNGLRTMMRHWTRPFGMQTGNLKCYEDNYPFRCMCIPFFGEIIAWQGVSPDPNKFKH